MRTGDTVPTFDPRRGMCEPRPVARARSALGAVRSVTFGPSVDRVMLGFIRQLQVALSDLLDYVDATEALTALGADVADRLRPLVADDEQETGP